MHTYMHTIYIYIYIYIYIQEKNKTVEKTRTSVIGNGGNSGGGGGNSGGHGIFDIFDNNNSKNNSNQSSNDYLHIGAIPTLLNTPVEKATAPVVFVPGVKASLLIDPTQGNRKVWVDAKTFLITEKSDDISLPIDFDDDGQQLGDHLKPGGVLHNLHVVGGLPKVPIYSPGLEYMRKEKKKKVFEFSYDWRRSNNETADKLQEYIEIQYKSTGKKIQMLCHSMGCMIGYVVMKRIPEKIHSCIFVSPPFTIGAPLFLLEQRDGHPMGLNKTILSSRTQFSWMSSYVSYPRNGTGIVDINNKPLYFEGDTVFR